MSRAMGLLKHAAARLNHTLLVVSVSAAASQHATSDASAWIGSLLRVVRFELPTEMWVSAEVGLCSSLHDLVLVYNTH